MKKPDFFEIVLFVIFLAIAGVEMAGAVFLIINVTSISQMGIGVMAVCSVLFAGALFATKTFVKLALSSIKQGD